MDTPGSPPVETVEISQLFCSPTNPRRNDAGESPGPEAAQPLPQTTRGREAGGSKRSPRIRKRMEVACPHCDKSRVIVNESVRLLNAYYAYITMAEDGRLVVRAATKSAAVMLAALSKLNPEFMTGSVGPSNDQTISTREPMIIEDIAVDERMTSYTRLAAQENDVHGRFVGSGR